MKENASLSSLRAARPTRLRCGSDVAGLRLRARLVRLRRVGRAATGSRRGRSPGGDESMSTIESVSHEHRIFEPPREFVAQANVKKADFDALNASAAARLRRLLGEARAGRGAVEEAVHEDARRVERAVLQVVRGRRAQCLLQLPRPQHRERQRGQGRDHLRGRRRRRDEGHVPGAATTASAASRTACGRSASGRATACSSTCRCRSRAWSRCRRARASARRIRSCSAAFRRSRCRSASSMPAPSP